MKVRGARERLLAATMLIMTLLSSSPAAANTLEEPNYRDAQFVQTVLSATNQNEGLQLVDGQPDGKTEPLAEGIGRKSMLSSKGGEQYFYFNVHDTYINGGLNKVVMTITYLDRGLTPIVLEYDAFDTLQPNSKEKAVIYKRLALVNRGNTESWRTERVTLENARFANNQAGGADFRIGSADQLVLRNVSVLRVSYEKPTPPIRVELDGKEVLFDVPPMIDPTTGRTLVPMRALFIALGVPNELIAWDSKLRQVTAQKGKTVIKLTIDQRRATINDVTTFLDQPAVIQNDRTLIPLRFVSEHFGLQVHWDPVLRVVTLRTAASPPPSGQ